MKRYQINMVLRTLKKGFKFHIKKKRLRIFKGKIQKN